MEYYWVQECRSKLNQTPLRFVKKSDESPEKIFVMRQIIHEEFGKDYYPEDYSDIKEKYSEKIKNCIKKIEGKCFEDVTYAFQNINDDFTDRPFFNYVIKKTKPRPDRNKGKPIIDRSKGIDLNPLAMDFFRRYNVALEKSITLEWAKYIEKFNLGVPALIKKIEGKKEDRKSTTNEKRALRKAGIKNCFYCNAPLGSDKETHVEHVIPFSFIYENEMWNFVLACENCNCKKLGRLPPLEFLDCLIKRNKKDAKKIEGLEKSISKLGEGNEKIIRDHYQNAKSHGFQIYDKFPKLDPDLCN